MAQIMGILNVTPDSFYAGSRKQTERDIALRADEIITQGGGIIDVGAMSTRPGGNNLSETEEMERLRYALPIVKRQQPEAIISVDTFRPMVARMVVEEFGVDIINDVGPDAIAASSLIETVDDVIDPSEVHPAVPSLMPMFREVARLGVDYVLMSRDANIETMKTFFTDSLNALNRLGAKKNIILDPGYGFGKTIEENYAILRRQAELCSYGLPILAGVSRKRMIWQLLGTSADEALNGTTVLHSLALQNGANILRAHDVREAAETIKILEAFVK